MKEDKCPVCQRNETDRLRSDLSECKKQGQSKDKKIKDLNKKNFVLTMIAIAIAAVFGKEALDAITEWIGSINGFRANVDGFAFIVPAPSTAALFALALIRPARRRKR
jgi:hypothetical protein